MTNDFDGAASNKRKSKVNPILNLDKIKFGFYLFGSVVFGVVILFLLFIAGMFIWYAAINLIYDPDRLNQTFNDLGWAAIGACAVAGIKTMAYQLYKGIKSSEED